jgi:NAD(P)-dependent dehydrogenase (short-subunit alcohol dehydrogenase family)
MEEATMSRLHNKVAVITGGTSGIGLAAAQRFAAEGAFVYIFARRQEELDKTVAAIGRNVAGVQGDVRKFEDLDWLYAKSHPMAARSTWWSLMSAPSTA